MHLLTNLIQKNKMQALINFDSKVNTMMQTYILKLSLQICRTNVRALKIDSSMLKIFKMVPTSFQI